MAGTETLSFITNPFFSNIILPFLLIFVVVFAILEKSEILGKDKKYANVIVALVIGFMFIAVQSFVGFTLRLIPLISVFIVILLSYFLIFGFIGVHQSKGLQITMTIIFGIAFIAAVLWATGLLTKWTASTSKADFIGVVTLVVIIGAAIALTVSSKGQRSSQP